jgi:hypothetical protein
VTANDLLMWIGIAVGLIAWIGIAVTLWSACALAGQVDERMEEDTWKMHR